VLPSGPAVGATSPGGSAEGWSLVRANAAPRSWGARRLVHRLRERCSLASQVREEAGGQNGSIEEISRQSGFWESAW